MRSYLSAVLLLLSLFSCLPTQKAVNSQNQVFPTDYQPLASDTFRVMSWNVEHFVDLYDNPYVQNRREDNPDSVAFEKKTALFTEVLRKADADIVVLQEIEHIQLAKQLAETVFPELNYRYFADAASINWYQNVVVMSRVPLGVLYSYGNVYSPVAYTDEEGQEQYETQSMINTRLWTIEVMVKPDYGFYLSGAHLKAGRGPRNEAMRLGQIGLLKEQFARFIDENQKANILLLGDMNSVPDSKEVAALKAGDKGVLLHDPLPADVLTHPADELERRLDYLFVNENMLPELVKGSAEVPMLLPADQMRIISDHLPVFADFVAAE